MIGLNKYLKALIISISTVILVGVFLFIGILRFGMNKNLQKIWVTTAMTTYSHKWLATSIVPSDVIDKIMEEARVDDSGYESEIIEFESPIDSVEDKEGTSLLSYASRFEHTVESDLASNKEEYEKINSGLFLKSVSGKGWKGNIMLVSDPKNIRIIDTPNQFKEGWYIRRMIEKSGAIAAVNAGGFEDPNYSSNGGIPAGLLIKDGKLINPKSANDTIYSMIGINGDGVLVLKKTSARWALDNDIQQAVSFSPYLIVNGEKTIKSGTGGWGIAPRTAIGQRPNGEILFLVIDGRQPSWSIGADLIELQDTLYNEGCINAAMLDGGSSTVMIHGQEFINRPSLGKERYVNNAWGIFK